MIGALLRFAALAITAPVLIAFGCLAMAIDDLVLWRKRRKASRQAAPDSNEG